MSCETNYNRVLRNHEEVYQHKIQGKLKAKRKGKSDFN